MAELEALEVEVKHLGYIAQVQSISHTVSQSVSRRVSRSTGQLEAEVRHLGYVARRGY